MNKLFAFLLCVLASTTHAQTEKRTIDVNGSAERQVVPNIIVLAITLKEYEESKTKIPIEKIDNEFLAVVKESNIPAGDIAIANLGVNAFYQRKRGRDFHSQKTYEITFSKGEDALTFLDNLKKVKVENVRIDKLSHTEIEKYKLDLKVEALKAAQRKANTLLTAIGSKLGNVIRVNENADHQIPYAGQVSNFAYHEDRNQSMAEYGNDVPIKNITLRFDISATFQID